MDDGEGVEGALGSARVETSNRDPRETCACGSVYGVPDIDVVGELG